MTAPITNLKTMGFGLWFRSVRAKSKKEKDTFLGYSIFIEIQFNVVTPNLPIPEKQVLWKKLFEK